MAALMGAGGGCDLSQPQFVTLKIETAEGLYGLGNAMLNGRELAVARPLVISIHCGYFGGYSVSTSVHALITGAAFFHLENSGTACPLIFSVPHKTSQNACDAL